MVCRITISGIFDTGQIAVRVYLTERMAMSPPGSSFSCE